MAEEKQQNPIMPAPIATEMGVRIAKLTSGEVQAQLICMTHQGMNHFFMPGDMAREIGEGLIAAADAIQTNGLTVVRGGLTK